MSLNAKKIPTAIVCITSMVLLSAQASANTQNQWTVEVKQWNVQGSFDYYLSHPNGQLESWVHAPQNQNMQVVAVSREVSPRRKVTLEYGSTKVQTKGRGADTDWAQNVLDSPSYYGNMDIYGRQTMVSLEAADVLQRNKESETSLHIGMRVNETSNELRNIVYQIENFAPAIDKTPYSQGSYLNGNFISVYTGLANRKQIGRQWELFSKINVSIVQATARAAWKNHSPVWTWRNKGYALGYSGEVGLQYHFSPDMWARTGYRYFYASMENGDEELKMGSSTYSINEQIGLRYIQRGFYYELETKF